MARVFETDITLNAQRELRLADADSSAYVGFKAPSTITTNRIWTLPATDGTSSQVLSTNGSGVLSWATAGGGGGLTHFVESEETASPNATVPVDALTATDASYTDIDVALVAKGTGATLAQVPDGTSAGGNKRGTYATDLQKIRSTAVQVASGNYSTIAGGYTNTASGLRSTVAGGNDNVASGQDSAVCGGHDNITSSNYSFIGGGQSNEAKTSTHATCAGGRSNDATGQYSFVGGGIFNTASGLRSIVVAGDTNAASGSNSCIVGGQDNIANASQSFVAGGRRGTVRSIVGNHIFPACSIPIANAQGATQSALLLLGRETTDATATVLCSNSSAASTTNQVILPNNAAYYFRGSVIAGVTAGGDSKAWTFEGAIKRGANSSFTAIVGTVVLNAIAQDAGASAWTVAVTADTTRGGIKVEVTGAAATTIRWVCKINTTEMTY
jgi:hypothetical protein